MVSKNSFAVLVLAVIVTFAVALLGVGQPALPGNVAFDVSPTQGGVGPMQRERISIEAQDSVWLVNGADLIMYSDARSTQKFVVDGATGNTTVAGALGMTAVNAAGGSANPWDYTGTLGIMNGSDDFTLFDVNITNADHTGSSNTVQVLDVANITGDAHATEMAIKIGTGWDAGLWSGSVIEADAGLTVDDVAFTVADTSGNVRTAGTLAVEGASTLTGTVTMVGAASVGGVLAADGGISMDGTNFVVNGTTGATTIAGALAANGGITVDTSAFTVADTSGNVTTAGTITAGGAVTATGNIGTGGFFHVPPESIIPTDGNPITPTHSFVILGPAGAVTPTIAACTAGQWLVLYNSENFTVTLADGDNFVLTGDLALTQYDTVQLACFAAKWVQIGPVSAN